MRPSGKTAHSFGKITAEGLPDQPAFLRLNLQPAGENSGVEDPPESSSFPASLTLAVRQEIPASHAAETLNTGGFVLDRQAAGKAKRADTVSIGAKRLD